MAICGSLGVFLLKYFCLFFVCFSYCSLPAAVIPQCIYFDTLLFNFAFLVLFFPPFSFSISPCLLVCFVFLLYSPVGTLLWSRFLACVLVSFVFNCLIPFLVSFVSQVALWYFLLSGLFWFCLCVYMDVPLFLLFFVRFCIYHWSRVSCFVLLFVFLRLF